MTEPRKRNISQKSELTYDCHSFGLIVDTREIFLCSDPDSVFEEAIIDHWAANNFIRNLRILNHMGKGKIFVHMITCGGVWEYGMAIYDAIKESCESEAGSEITILAYGHARSMSSIIPQAATKRIICPNADFLIHDGVMGVEGNLRSVISEADWAHKQRDVMLDIYVSRCKDGAFWKRERMNEKDIKLWIGNQIDKKQEFYLSARDAVDKGFMDAVLGDDKCETIEMLRS